MKTVITTLLILLLVSPYAAAAGELVTRANAAYEEGNYAQARRLYEQALTEQGPHTDLYFNLGNTCYRLDDLGMSIYYYRLAVQADPGNRDAERNLAFIRGRRIDKLAATPVAAWRHLLAYCRRWDGTIATCGNYLLFFALGGFIMRRRRYGAVLAGIGAIMLLLGAGLLAQRGWATAPEPRVIIASKADVYSSPRVDLPILTVHAGLEVEVKRTSGTFAELTIGDGVIGWVKANALSPPLRLPAANQEN